MTRRRVTVTLEVQSSEALKELRRFQRWNAALADSTLARTTVVLQAQANVIGPPKGPQAVQQRRRRR